MARPHRTGAITVGDLIAGVAIAAVLHGALLGQIYFYDKITLFLCLYVKHGLPQYFILRAGRPKLRIEVLAIIELLAFSAWGAILCHWPALPPRRVQWFYSADLGMRLCWGVFTVFYALTLVDAFWSRGRGDVPDPVLSQPASRLPVPRRAVAYALAASLWPVVFFLQGYGWLPKLEWLVAFVVTADVYALARRALAWRQPAERWPRFLSFAFALALIAVWVIAVFIEWVPPGVEVIY